MSEFVPLRFLYTVDHGCYVPLFVVREDTTLIEDRSEESLLLPHPKYGCWHRKRESGFGYPPLAGIGGTAWTARGRLLLCLTVAMFSGRGEFWPHCSEEP